MTTVITVRKNHGDHGKNHYHGDLRDHGESDMFRGVREMIEALDGEGQLALVHLLAAIPAAGRSARLAELAALEARRPFREDRAAYMRRWRKRHETGERR